MDGEPVLIISDEKLEGQVLAFILNEARLAVTVCSDISTLSSQIKQAGFKLLILVAKDDGIAAVRTIRSATQLPLILLNNDFSETHRIAALEAGADLVFTRPCDASFLAIQLPILIRRFYNQSGNKPYLQANHFIFEICTHIVRTRNGSWFQLSPHEFRFLYSLMIQPAVVVATDTLTKQVWEYPDFGDREMLRKLVHRLRHKLEDEHQLPRSIFNVPNVGYYFEDPQDN